MAAGRKKGLGWQGQVVLTSLAICGVLFTPTTTILLAGMLPTLVAAYADRTRERMRGITVGAMNMAGCTPFIMDLWLSDHTIENALNILSSPTTWIIMYAAAGVGYCLEWVVVGTVSIFASERAQMRINQIEAGQEQLVERWGAEVTGKIPLDEDGFPVRQNLDL
ncbi:MAG: hypothetical protein H6855_00270 [Rhodospirillales bacterium]|nr:hypothetical protein [Rhodospirillales bacterium]MCB9964503.1 hypothetical protein [Rhodospirillales bacterium]MCB9973776.1 hypothetical protein [Rhodospirillales bacterium]MCB9980340.1 hypothetical protein [Rhodospirillales bacterium]